MTDISYTNIGDVVAAMVIIGFAMIIPAIVVFIFYNVVNKNGNRTNGRQSIELEKAAILQKQIDELDDRVAVLEKVLRNGE